MKKTDKNANSVLETTLTLIGGTVSFFAILLLSAAYHGWALSLLWKWFVTTTFGLPALSIGQAAGISLVANLIVYRTDLKSTREGWDSFLVSLLQPPIYLGVGLLIRWWWGL